MKFFMLGGSRVAVAPYFRKGRFLTNGILLSIAWLVISSSYASTWYVSKTGSDSNPGTQALPKLTINGAIDLMSGGDSVIIGAGTYDEILTNVNSSGVQSFTNPIPSGTSGLRTTFQAASGADVWLKPTTNSYPGGGGAITLTVWGSGYTPEYITFDGINIDAEQNHTAGIYADGNYNTFKNAEITDAYGQGVDSFNGNGSIFSNLHVHHNGLLWEPPQNDPDAPAPHGFYIGGTNKTIEYSEVNDHPNYGIQASKETGGLNNITVNGNYVHDNVSRAIQVQGPNALITNNLVVDNGIGIGTANSGAKIFNNTIHGWTNTVSDSYGIIVGASSTEVKNNIITAQDTDTFSGCKSRYIYWLSGTPTFGGNVCDLSRTGCGIVDSVNDIYTDAANNDFSLATGSAAIGYAVSTTPSITTDITGATRTSPFDSGAYEVGSGGGGPPGGDLHQVTQNFSSNPNWEGFNNNANNQNFGYLASPSNKAGGAAAGEIGGQLDRGPVAAWYAASVGEIDASSDPLSATGKFAIDRINSGTSMNGQTNFGWFDKDYSSSAQLPSNFIGFFANGDGGGANVYAQVIANGASSTAFIGHLKTITNPVGSGLASPQDFSLTFDPTANGGNGSLIFDLGTFSPVTINLSSGAKDAMATLDRFGLIAKNDLAGTDPIRRMMAYVDDLNYTSANPEPSTVVLFGIGAMIMLLYGGKARRR